jgi:predicted ribosomally synthesized peptide with SipW-like signal peptide
MNKKILMSLGAIVMVAAVAISATGAFFNDTERSTGNTFSAGALDLRVDSTAHYNHMICVDTDEDGFGDQWQPEPGFFPEDVVPADHYPQPGMECNGTWTESDLIADALQFRFFDLTDVKPGDVGEDTISLHVYDNDAWGCFLVDNVVDQDVTCNEPESESSDPECSAEVPTPGAGELGAALTFDAWLDQGTIPGFQNIDAEGNAIDTSEDAGVQAPDPEEGDNLLNSEIEVLFWENETIDQASEGPFDLRDVLSTAYSALCSEEGNPTGADDYGTCQGLAVDGRMVGSTTYYFGLAWNVPAEAGNEIQTDQLVTDMVFEAVQHRNNPDFQCTQPVRPVTTLTLAKAVNPPQAALDTDFNLFATGPTPIFGVEGTVAVTNAEIGPGVYSLSETGSANPSLWSLAGQVWVCDGNVTPEIDNNDGTATVTIAEGEQVVCGVTNTYTPAL